MSDGLDMYRACLEKVLRARENPRIETDHLIDEIEQEYQNNLKEAQKRVWFNGEEVPF
jgi:hypothetical protein